MNVAHDVDSDESTGDGGDDITVEVVARLVPRTCNWVRLVHRVLLKAFNAREALPVCFLFDGRWYVYSKFIVLSLLDPPGMRLLDLLRRSDIKVFLKCLAGQFLHLVNPNDEHETWADEGE